MYHLSNKPIIRYLLFALITFVFIGCNRAEEVAEPTPKPVEAATVEVPPTSTPEPTATAVPEEPTPVAEPTEIPDPTIDPENDGTLLKAPVMQDAPIQLEFSETEGLLVANGIGPIAPASSVNFNFTGQPGQTFKAQVEGGTFGGALLFNGSVVPVTLIQGRASVWELSQGGKYEYSISNGGSGANYTYDFSLTQTDGESVVLSPQKIPFGQGVSEQSLMGEIVGTEPVIYFFDGFEGQKFSISLVSDSSKMLFINVETGDIAESSVGSSAFETPPLPNNGEYRVEVSGPSAETFELNIALLP